MTSDASDVAVVSADKAMPLPDDIDDTKAVAVLMQGITAQYLATDTFPITSGDVVLVHVGPGGVGQLLAQIAMGADATVLGKVSSPSRLTSPAGSGSTMCSTTRRSPRSPRN